MAAHTHGPWTVGRKVRRMVFAEGSAGAAISEAFDDEVGRDQANANATLIAAAPELLEMLQLVTESLSDCETQHHVFGLRGRIERARAAIAKATGA